ncbi:pyridoxal phosphate-dependent aminotransferase [Haladaptatus cibarius]|uniref:pyridoxal phosphate-dependent aminotransferase n=1 Tax=Haladaptatus cibarius TaxID=453847 RepID=UPI000A841A0A|nr:pyridoxal phosphate-dependent aminotransferase [Haladaptatus cibarius]
MVNIDHSASRMDRIPFSGIRKIFEECDRLEQSGTDVVHLEIGRPDFDTPSEIKQAGSQALSDGHVHYTSNYGIAPLRSALADKLSAENRIDYEPESEIVVTTGATEAIFVTMLALVEEGDEVLIPDPCWTYASSIRMAGGNPVTYELDPETGFKPDLDSLTEAVSERTKLLVLNSPHNPTGGVVDQDTLNAIGDFVIDNDLLLLSDEIYEKIRYDGSEHLSPAAENTLFNRTVTINGFSKAYSMTGWRLGYLAAPAELINSIVRVRQYTTTCAPSISQHAGVRALQSGLHEPMVNAFARRRERIMERIENIPGMSCPTLSGAFYAFPTTPDGYPDEEEFVWSLLREAGVAFVPGSVFGESGHGRFRIAYSNSVERIDEAFDRLEDWL